MESMERIGNHEIENHGKPWKAWDACEFIKMKAWNTWQAWEACFPVYYF